jgi:low affinity Fe/Cu permease
MERQNRQGISSLVRRIDAITSRATTAGLVAVVLVACALAAAAFGVPDSWLAKFSACAAAITLVMVFVIQHTQSREQLATQLKLDELIRALPQADDHLVHVEEGSDDELRELEKRQVDHHVAVRDGEEFPR